MAADYYPARGGGATDVIRFSYFIRSTKTFSTFLSRPQRIEISFIYMPYSIRLGMPIIKADSPTSVGKNTSIAG